MGFAARLYFISLLFIGTSSQWGFAINGIHAGDRTGYSVSLGTDVNGDKIGDIIVGANPMNNSLTVQGYVIFGSSLFPPQLDLNTLNGLNGFSTQRDIPDDSGGWSVSLGDINGDSIGDMILGSDTTGFGITAQSYVIFGSNSPFSPTIQLGNLNSSKGFTVLGIPSSDGQGISVSLEGDVNGDNINDIYIGSVSSDSGHGYIVYGSTQTFPKEFNVSNIVDTPSTGIHLIGTTDKKLGFSGSLGGDVNGDGISDILISAQNNSSPGKGYVIYGSNTLSSSDNVNNMNSNQGFVIVNNSTNDNNARWTVSVGKDVNGDEIDDILIGSPFSGNSGKCYLIFGQKNSAFPSEFNLNNLNGTNGFLINGVDAGSNFGWSVSLGGDFNGDKTGDMLISAPNAGKGANTDRGVIFVIFGKDTSVDGPFDSEFRLNKLNGHIGFSINGIGGGDQTGFSLSLGGDVTGDGIDDFIVGAYTASYNGINEIGRSYVIFGRDASSKKQFPAVINLSNFNSADIDQTISIRNVTVEIEQDFSFQINENYFATWLGSVYNVTSSSLPLWLNFSSTSLTFEGKSNELGNFLISIDAQNNNGKISVRFVLNVVPKQREFQIALNQAQSFSFQVPDPSGGEYLFEAKITSGGPLPAFLTFNGNSLIMSTTPNIEIKPQTVFVSITGTDRDGQEQVSYDYSLVFTGSQEKTSDSDSDADVNIGAIVGGTLGGVCLLGMLVFAVVLICSIWQRKKMANSFKSGPQ